MAPGANSSVNAYARLAADATAGATTLVLGAVAGSCTLDPASLLVNDLLLVIQAQGATISWAVDDATYGTVTSLNSAGRFELVTVRSVAGSVVTIDAVGLSYGYTTAGNAQVVRVPQYTTVTVGGGTSIVPASWDGRCGGIVAIDVQGAATVDGAIDATGRGFRGGALDPNSAGLAQDIVVYRSTDDREGAEKGEGIAGNATTYDSLGGRYGRGAPANGGGGGNSHNAGGGGGANGRNGVAWNGQGNPDTTVGAWVTAWNIDGTLTAATTSSGGGRGGCSFSTNNLDALLNPPGGSGWGGNRRRERGGLGGRPLDNDPASGRLFMGGGGGAGDQNDACGGAGGSGGGIVVLYAASVSGTGSLLANGMAGANAVGEYKDGSGGGGGGGSIVVRAATSVAGLMIQANGGVGGSQPQPTSSPSEAEGPGGGGGGGFVRVDATAVTATRIADGGANGTTASSGLSEFPPNGATRGGSGQTIFFSTAVELMSFDAVGGVESVILEWRTGSELDNLGFHVHRAVSEGGPYERVTGSLIQGLGSSPVGASYGYIDSGLVPGRRYYYRLEDVDTSSVSTFHGPVSAVPEASSPPPPGGGGGGGGEPGDGSGPGGRAKASCPAWVLAAYESGASSPGAPAGAATSPICTKHGDPESVSLDVVSHDASSATLELRTGGFWAAHAPSADGLSGEPSGTVRVFVPGFDSPTEPTAPSLPLRRALVDAVVGKKVSLVSAEAMDLRSFRGLRPSAVGLAEMAFGRDGTVRAGRRAVGVSWRSRGYVPGDLARLVGTVFQGERKSAVLEIAPVRLAGRVRVKLGFTGVVAGERGAGSWGRAWPRGRGQWQEVAQVHTSGRGLYGVRYEDLFPQRLRGYSTRGLRLQRQGEAVAFHVEPARGVFGPGSVLYFFAERTAGSGDYSSEVAYELVRLSGVEMGVGTGRPEGVPVVSSSRGFTSFETNRFYRYDLLEAPDVWLWQWATSGAQPPPPLSFSLSGLVPGSVEGGQLVVDLQGATESGEAVDHHVRLFVNGGLAGETTFAGKRAHRVELGVGASVLREGANEIRLENVGDTGVYSQVFLDRFEVGYPQTSLVRGGVFEGVWPEGGTVEVGGLTGPPIVLDVTGAGVGGSGGVRWLRDFETGPGSVRFEAEGGHRYVVVSPEGVLTPRIGRVGVATLRGGANQAEYVVIAPREFLGAAEPLLERRRAQGLLSRAVSFEQISSEFGHGQPSGEAIREFLRYAYHTWQRPSLRYVLLLGDSTYDPRRFLSTSPPSPLPALWARTSYMWTVSDPALGAVNGEDLLPDLSIGRLPATTVEQAQALISKLLSWEESGQDLGGNAVLVADGPDQGGDFEWDVEDIRSSFLSERVTTTLKVSELGGGTRGAILGAFDEGASLMSYVGHGGATVWATENVLNSWDVPSLRAQSRQPLLLTMNCLNGYFVDRVIDSLPEALLKAGGRGVIAAFSPSGLSLDGPAHLYHRALVEELTSGRHQRLGDAILAAQTTYAETGLMPELLTVYHLFGDPAMTVR